ncbi:MAG: hypothetical protein EAZ20_08775 [Bacteroidetes bacterium]|nr:MAG: hypothetical protein EAZ20_08775 [Bacteroidota bacterium]
MKNTKKVQNENNETVEATPATVIENVTEVVTETAETFTSTTKSAFNVIKDAQSKMVENLVKNSKKFVETIGATETIEKTREFMNEWLEKQQNNLEGVSELIKEQIQFEKAPTLVKEVVEAQEKLGKEWFEALRVTLKVEEVKDLEEILTANVNKLQENVKEITSFWKENLTQPTKIKDMFTTEYATEFTKKMVDMWTPVIIKK